MTFGEAETLIVRMSQTWTRSNFSEEWFDFLQGFDAGKAGTTFLRLRSTMKHPPSMAEFGEVYRTIRDDTDARPVCRHCSGSGMVPSGDDEWHPESVPCHCPDGERMAKLTTVMAPGKVEPAFRLTEQECADGLAGIAYVRSMLDDLRANRRNL